MSSEIDKILQGLNEQQHNAVIYEEGSLAVIAGAGSGKTSVLTKRIAYLCSIQNLRSYQILAVTFTNKAAREMTERLIKLGIPSVDQMWSGTFHGIAYKILRKHHEIANLNKNFQIIDPQEQEKIMKKIFKSNDWSTEENSIKDCVHYINAKKDAGIRPFNCVTDNALEDFYKDAYTQYQDMCDDNSWVDFGELLLRAFEITRDCEEIRHKYQRQFSHILVDEFQDTNDIQYDWINILSEKGQAVPVTVVGDMDQSIYSWRGAKMTNVQRFVEEYSSVKMIKLEQNYRSTHHILNCSNSLIKNNLSRIDKNLWTSQNKGELVTLFEASNEKEEGEWVVSQATKQFNKTKKWSDTAVLYRSNAQSRIIEEAFIKRNIPYKIYGGVRFFERTEIKDALAHLYVCMDIDNDLMLERALSIPTKGFGNKAVDALRQKSMATKKSWASLLSNEAFCKDYVSPKAKKAWGEWREKWRKNGSSGKLEDKVRWVIEQTGLLEHYEKIDEKEKTERSQNLKELISVAKRFSQGKSETSDDIVLDFLSSATLETDHINGKDGDAVQLMTVHASKGLEFKSVCAIGWDEGMFPSSQSASDPEKLEEERRLAYVAITRAEHCLYISGAVERRQYGQVLRLKPSKFLTELPASSIHWYRRPSRNGSMPKDYKVPTITSNSNGTIQSYWKVGQKVKHPSFGVGKIVRVDGFNKNDRVMIAFYNGEKKILLPQLAKIELVK